MIGTLDKHDDLTRNTEIRSVRQILASFNHALNVEELARVLNCTKGTIYRRVKAGVLPSRMVGGELRFDPAKIADWWEGKKIN